MGIDMGLVIVIAAVLLFYLRLILVQRQKARLFRQSLADRKGKKGKGRAADVDYSILSLISARPQDRLIAGIGAVMVVLGVLFNAQVIPWALGHAYWYIPVAAGILAFSWIFR